MPRPRRQPPTARPRRGAGTADLDLADRLHSAAIHLLRRLRVEDQASGLSAPRLSALSVLVFGGPRTVSELARDEQVSKPTISRLVKDLEAEGLVEREGDASDRRVSRIRATARGLQILRQGRARRVAALTEALAALTVEQRRLLGEAAEILERVAVPQPRRPVATKPDRLRRRPAD